MTDFWAAKRAELQKQGKIPSARPEPVKAGPWWADGMSIPGVTQTPQVSNPDTSVPQTTAELERNAQIAQKKQDSLGACPNCGSGNYMKSPTDHNLAAHCFDCGFASGRVTNDLDTFTVITPEASLKVRQTASSQGQRMGTSVAEINAAHQALEQSLIGKAAVE